MLLRSSLSLTFNFRKLVQSDSELGTVLKEPNSSSFTTAEPNVFKLVLPRHRICAEMQTRVSPLQNPTCLNFASTPPNLAEMQTRVSPPEPNVFKLVLPRHRICGDADSSSRGQASVEC